MNSSFWINSTIIFHAKMNIGCMYKANHVPSNTKDSIDLQKIVQACSQAWYLVSITPIKSFEAREKRTSMNIDMDFQTILNTYFESKVEFRDKKDDLIKKTLALQYEAEEFDEEVL
jgi:hypothetical protein